MQYSQLKGKGFIVLGALMISVAACNSNGSSGTVADTSIASATDRPDTMQQDQAATTSPVTSPEENAPASAATSAPSTSASTAGSSTSSTTASSNTNTKTKKVIVKKKVEAIVEVVPVAKHPKTKMDRTGVYEYAEVSPEYSSGQVGIEKYINNHIEYPPQALDNNVEGRVEVSFVVNENGRVTDAHVIGKGLKDGLSQEAVRVVASMPGWKPGTIKGKPIKTRMTMPITFRIIS